ncbi:NADH dehydrogenase [Panus rudis PR-1116 ss-1]|nr:NADH dehydrogenase [Panus rudis PR-1116 ss-1]
MNRKVVICGAGFLVFHEFTSNVARAICGATANNRVVQLASRHPNHVHETIQSSLNEEHKSRSSLVLPISVDITDPSTLTPALQDASVVISLVGILQGKPEDFFRIQLHGAENVAKAAKAAGAKLIHISAIGADPSGSLPYEKTKGLAEKSVLQICKDATIIRPSIVFGPGDSFFTRFAKLSAILPFMPVFGDGSTKFQPVFVGDIARAVEIISRNDPDIRKMVDGKVLEAGGPDVFTYRQIMELVLKYTGRTRTIIPLPFAIGKLQGAILEQLPQNIFTLTRDQVEQLKKDNVVTASQVDGISFEGLLKKFSSDGLTSVHEVLPKYL